MYAIPKINLGDIVIVKHDEKHIMPLLIIRDDDDKNKEYYTAVELTQFMIPFIKECKWYTLESLAKYLSEEGKYKIAVKLNIKSVI